MNALRSLIILALAFTASIVAAHKPIITGKVQDGKSYAPIPYANISIIGTKTGCATDKEGEFSIVIDTIPVYMIVSHLGYETQRIWLESASGGLNILMRPVASFLQEIEIKSKSEPVPFFKDGQYAVLDYEVDNTLVYLLIYRFRLSKSELICKSDDGDTIARSGNLPFRPSGIFSDCLGYLHVLSPDSAYQVYLGKDTLIFPYKADIQKFKSTMLDCVTSTENWLIFRKESKDHQTVDFYRIDRKTKEKQYLASVSDNAKLRMLRYNPFDHYLLVMDTLPNSPAEIAEWIWVNKILYKPNVSVMEKIGDTLAVFNTTDGTLDLYNLNGIYISGTEMPFLQNSEEKWTKEIYIDEIADIPYTSFLKNGRLVLYRIDLNTGDLKRVLAISHLFPQKIRIHHNYVFYLFNIPGTGDNKHLFRQKVDN